MKPLTVFLSLLFLISACTSAPSQTQGCYSEGKSVVANEAVRPRLAPRGDLFSELEGNEFTASELDNAEYGYQLDLSDTGYYVGYELCNLDTNTVADSSGFLEDPGTMLQREGVGSTTGQYTEFSYQDINGNQHSVIKEAGMYSINVYLSTDGEQWEWAAQRVFTVIEP